MDRRTFMKAAGATGAAAAVTSVGVATAAEAEAANPIQVAKYKLLVPEIFKALPDAPATNKAIVIGSGFGAAVTAYRLGQAGVQTAVLERGSRWPNDLNRNIFTTDANPDGRGFWHRTKFTGVSGLTNSFDDFGGVLDVTEFDGLDVWHGAAVGGGSIVYTGATIEPEERFFKHVFGLTGTFGDVGALYNEMHNTYYPMALANLGATPMPDKIYNSNAFTHSRTWDAQSAKAGYAPQVINGIWNWDTVQKEIDGKSSPSCIMGASNLGNSNGAKQDLNYSYLKWAEATGKAKIYAGHQVTDIKRSGNLWAVTVQKIDPTGKVLSTRTLTAEKLFLGAGSINTTELLLKAKATGALPNLPSAIGKGWGTNGDAAIVRVLTLGGFTQGAASRSRILDETTTPGLPVTLENWYVPGLPVDLGMIGSLGMVLDDTRGSFTYDTTAKKLKLSWPGQDAAKLAMRAVNNKIAKAAGVSVGFPPLAPDVNTTFTAHPLGGAVIGQASDNYGRVNGYPGLYVVDGAGIPGSTGTVNPTLTITALAERNIAKIRTTDF
ncbi:GMC oxidoreductase [Spongisporangium articulatum]|uniref:Cholesterol oxidase n=1 Tax=Spongisporangium articulatum TaxID=3362603 RepID=A0ABW8APS5_9ACTN